MLDVYSCLSYSMLDVKQQYRQKSTKEHGSCGCCPHYERIVLRSLLQHVVKD
jgi:hypothetical protein